MHPHPSTEQNLKAQIFNEFFQNHPNPINRLRMQSRFNITKQHFIAELQKLNEFLGDFKLHIIGIGKSGVVKLDEGEKYFIHRRYKNGQLNESRLRTEEEKEDFKFKVLIFSIIHIENQITFKKLNYLLKDYFNFKIDQLIRLKRDNYLKIIKEDEEEYFTFSWRFYVEFPKFNPLKILESLKI